MGDKVKDELAAIEKFEKKADELFESGKKGKELMVELVKDKELIKTLGTLEYIPPLADDDQEKAEQYYNSLTEEQKTIVSKYYNLFVKMETYSNGEGGESKRDKKFAAFYKSKSNP